MTDQELSTIFKAEYSNLIAVLCHHYGTSLDLAEDLVSEAFLAAVGSWSHKGLPTSPKAWLRTAAVNKLRDHHRRQKTYHEKVLPQVPNARTPTQPSIDESVIADSQLRMIFVVCDPALSQEAQLSLALRLLCGFGIEEIAKALLTTKSTVNKRIYRGKQRIKSAGLLDQDLSRSDYVDRLDRVLRVIYLLFNEGYYSAVSEQTIRQDICWEAMRLAVFLSRQQGFPLADIHALLALMCFHASRLAARSDGNSYLLYHEQDRSLWDRQLIQKGESYLNRAASGDQVSKYHIEAAIAYWHTTDSADKWGHILQLYNKLLIMEYSPVIAMNRTFALAMAEGAENGLAAAQQLDLEDNIYYLCLLAELHRMQGDGEQELVYLREALKLATREQEIKLIKRKIDRVGH